MRPGEDGHVEYLGARALRETGAGLLVLIPGHGEVWLPKAKIHDNSEVYRADTSGRLVIPLWLAEAKGLPT